MDRLLYQTLEKRKARAINPGFCSKSNAWLGNGFYFWLEELDAHRWGQDARYNSRHYEIYKSVILFDNVLNTVFEEKAYNFFVKLVETAAAHFIKKINERPTIKQLNDYFKDHGVFKDIDGILFQDLPKNPTYGLVQELYYKKRIQLCVYNKQIILTFEYHLDGECLDD